MMKIRKQRLIKLQKSRTVIILQEKFIKKLQKIAFCQSKFRQLKPQNNWKTTELVKSLASVQVYELYK